MPDQLLRGLVGESVRVVAALTTETCREAAARHGASPAASVALARTTSAALLLATLTKGDERVTLQIIGDGPLRGVTAVASDAGDARAYVIAPGVGGDVTGRVSLAPLVGSGVVSVLRDLGLREQYQGRTALVSGEIDEDVESYLSGSEQVVSALATDGVVGEAGLVAAGGVLVQCLPGGDVEMVTRARARLRAGAVHDALAAGVERAADLASRVLATDFEVLDLRPVRFHCPCGRERVLAALTLVGRDELLDMRKRDRGAEVTCNFCNSRYQVAPEELDRLIDSLPRA
jgi:molecular chaperone Hsp33